MIGMVFELVVNCKVGLRPLCSVITLLPTDMEVPGLNPDFDVKFFSSKELFHSMCGLSVSLSFVHVVPCCLRRSPLHSADYRTVFLCVVQRIFLHYRTLAFKFLIKVEFKLETKERKKESK